MNNQPVQAWEETVLIPTYAIGESEKNPMFLEKRVYQGSSGVVYPHAVIEKINDEKQDQAYKAIFIENQYLKIMVLPELGGRIQMAYDKVRERHFVYYNQVIKPALVGLTGPWISGGIEFNWPQHHRPSTFEPVDFTIEANPDGSKTVWVNEVERMFSTKGMAGFTLYPDKAYLEIKGVLYNRTALPQTFLWWANPAVKVNDAYQSIFPPDVYAVFDHGKRDVSSFPIATGTYYKVDYAPGTDISGYKNIPVPTSYMAIQSKYDFMGGYEHDTQGGLLHVANHHVSPGKKQWTWGNGEFGYAWDRNLTDEDGPYIELMTGVFTDNQPDFSWIMPQEERRFTQYFMPYHTLGVVKNASKEAACSLVVTADALHLKVYTTALYEDAQLQLWYADSLLWEESYTISPAQIVEKTLELSIADETQLTLKLYDKQAKLLLSYTPEVPQENALPSPAQAALPPAEVENNEQLFLTGQHIEQYRHATYLATDYYEEALRRDPKDSRCNNAMGLWYYKKGQFAQAKPYFEKAIATLTARNPNPYDSEAYYNLGLCLKKLGENDKAYTAFYKATWSAAWQDVALLELARLKTIAQDYEEALNHVSDALFRNYKSHTARHLKIALLRKLGRIEEALQLAEESIRLDKFTMGAYVEKCLLLPQEENLLSLKKLMRGYVHNYLEYAFDYLEAGLWDECQTLLQWYVADAPVVYPMVHYVQAFAAAQQGDLQKRQVYLALGKASNPDKVFPNRLTELNVLLWATAQTSEDGNVYYFLGNFWYAHRQYAEAIACWEACTRLLPEFPTSLRNLSLAYHNKEQNEQKALEAMEMAYRLDTSDARVLMELDQLYKKLNYPQQERFDLLTSQQAVTVQRDDLYLEWITLHNQLGKFAEAKALLAQRQFHPWEGGEGKVISQFLWSQVALTLQAIRERRWTDAVALLDETIHYPHNLGEGKLYGTQENDICFLRGLIAQLQGKKAEARAYFQQATQGLDEPVQAIFYNDPQPDSLFYQGLAWLQLGEKEKGEAIFHKLIKFGQAHLYDKIKIDYFAVSLPDLLVFDVDLDQRNHIHCQYLMGLGHVGLGNFEQAEEHFEQALLRNLNHQGVLRHQAIALFLREL